MQWFFLDLIQLENTDLLKNTNNSESVFAGGSTTAQWSVGATKLILTSCFSDLFEIYQNPNERIRCFFNSFCTFCYKKYQLKQVTFVHFHKTKTI